MNTLQDRIRGSLIGGAIGDALGYPVEFIYSFEEIQKRYGERGITRLDIKQHWLEDAEQAGKAVVSDDTQMTLFTAVGLLFGETRGMMRGIGGPHPDYIRKAYLLRFSFFHVSNARPIMPMVKASKDTYGIFNAGRKAICERSLPFCC